MAITLDRVNKLTTRNDARSVNRVTPSSADARATFNTKSDGRISRHKVETLCQSRSWSDALARVVQLK